MEFYDFTNSDEYKKYIEKNEGIYLNKSSITTNFIQRFVDCGERTRLLKLGYSVFLNQDTLEDKVVDYCYRPYIVLEKISHDEIKADGSSITMTEIKQMTHEYVHNSEGIYSLDCTYVRESDKEKYTMPDMPIFAELIDMHMKKTETLLMEHSIVDNEFELYKILSKEVKVLDAAIYSKDPKFDIGIYVKAQDKDQYKHTFNDCHYFKISKIGARYCCELNAKFELLRKINSGEIRI